MALFFFLFFFAFAFVFSNYFESRDPVLVVKSLATTIKECLISVFLSFGKRERERLRGLERERKKKVSMGVCVKKRKSIPSISHLQRHFFVCTCPFCVCLGLRFVRVGMIHLSSPVKRSCWEQRRKDENQGGLQLDWGGERGGSRASQQEAKVTSSTRRESLQGK